MASSLLHMSREMVIDFSEAAAQVTAVVSLPLSGWCSLIVAFDGRGWRFHSWRERGGRPLESVPSPADRALYFESPGEARRYFEAVRRCERRASDQFGEARRRNLRLAV